MTENYEHFITKNIIAYYRKRIIAPLLYAIVLAAAWFVFSLGDIVFTKPLPAGTDLNTYAERRGNYVGATLTDLNFTGYISTANGFTNGYFYYTKWADTIAIVLLSPHTCEQGLPYIDELNIYGKIVDGGKSYDELLDALSIDLDWTAEGIRHEIPRVYISEPANHYVFTSVMFFFYFGSLLFAAANIMINLIHIIWPATAPACQNLIVFGHPVRLLREAEEELATLPQLATEDMFITEHYFIMTGPDANAIVPIDQILWIYKHSTLHKFLWYHFSISYTMHITARKHLYIHCPKNLKSDIDGIMDYLAEANHDIVVGFSEENRVKVQEETGKPFHIEKIVALLRKKI